MFKGRYFYYPRSKLFQILHAKKLQEILIGKKENFKGGSYSLSPGRVFSSAWGKMFPKIFYPFFWIIGKLTMKTVEEGSQTSVFCALDEELEKDEMKGFFFENCQKGKASQLTEDEELKDELWEFSMKLIEDWEKESNGVFFKETIQ